MEHTHNELTQAVILAAGKGTRMGTHTQAVPKPMLQVQGKNLIEWKLEALPESVTEVIIIVGYLKEVIQSYFGDSWKGRAIRYVEQIELNGTGGALWQAKELLHGRFIVLMGDDLYHRSDLEAISQYPLAIAVKEHGSFSGGRVVANERMELVGVEEGTHESGLYNFGVYVLDAEIFNYPLQLAGNGKSNEFGLPQTIAQLAKDKPVQCCVWQQATQITAPEDLANAEINWKL